jgi:hypothetical protein
VTVKSTAADAPHEGWMQSSTCRAVDAAGRAAGREYGLAESMSRTLARLLRRQAKQKIGSADAAGNATLNALAQAFAFDRLEELGDELVGATTLAEWLAGVTAPAPAPGLPDYTKDVQIDFDPSGSSIDTYMKAGMLGGGEAIIHLRIQKWYQPDLDRHLYEESKKLERKHGKMLMVLVFLLWPPADGPGTTGRFETVDAKGKKQVFTYAIRKAWEMSPEEVMHGPGTMLLAPLTKDSRRRMPEIMQMVRQGLAKCKADVTTQEGVWDAIYWSMGLICDLDEAHRALGDLLPLVQRGHHYRACIGQAFLDAYSAGQSEGPATAARALVLRQATRRFGASPGADEKLASIATFQELEGRAQRVLSAADWLSLWATAA